MNLYTNIKLGAPPQNIDVIIDFQNYHSYIMKDKENEPKNIKDFIMIVHLILKP